MLRVGACSAPSPRRTRHLARRPIPRPRCARPPTRWARSRRTPRSWARRRTTCDPAAGAEPANHAVQPFAKEAEPILRKQIRPSSAPRGRSRAISDAGQAAGRRDPRSHALVHRAQPPVRPLRLQPRAVARAREDGPQRAAYLFWIAWVTHGRQRLLDRDAHGPYRPDRASAGRAVVAARVASACPVGRSSLNLNLRPALGSARRLLMQKQAPSFGRILTMVLFALSCFGLLLFLWISFGGAIPLKPKGYQFKIAFPEATQLGLEADVRDGRRAGGQGARQGARPAREPHARHDRARRQVRAGTEEREGDPAPEDAARRDLRRADAGHAAEPDDPRGRHAEERPRSQPTVELDEIFRPSTRRRGRRSRPGSRTWRELYRARPGPQRRFGNLPTFATDATDAADRYSTRRGRPCSA